MKEGSKPLCPKLCPSRLFEEKIDKERSIAPLEKLGLEASDERDDDVSFSREGFLAEGPKSFFFPEVEGCLESCF